MKKLSLDKFLETEDGMQSLQIVCVIAIAAVILISAGRAGRRSLDWMNNQTAVLEHKTNNPDQPELKFQPGFHKRPEVGGVKQEAAPAALGPNGNQYKVVLAKGGVNNGFAWKNSKSRNGYVEASMEYLTQNNFNKQSIGFYLDQEFAVQTNTHLDEMKKSELNRLVENASRLTVMALYEASKNGTEPKTLMKKMLQKIAARGDTPATWRLAQNLKPKNWVKLMAAFDQLSLPEQKEFARRFGSDRLTGEVRIKDGFEKLAAVTLQKGLRATALKQTKPAREIGKILDKVSKLPLPKYVTESFSAYAKVLDTTSVSIAKMLTSPDSPSALVKKITEETSMDSLLALKMTRNLREVYSKSPPKEQMFKVDDLPDHPEPK